jgi:hypothetical protein
MLKDKTLQSTGAAEEKLHGVDDSDGAVKGLLRARVYTNAAGGDAVTARVLLTLTRLLKSEHERVVISQTGRGSRHKSWTPLIGLNSVWELCFLLLNLPILLILLWL